jgi:uncharacterized protein (TIGR02231 family)
VIDKEDDMTQLATNITSATVYPDRALLTRRGTHSMEAGAHSLEITELPLSLNPDSFRLSAHGTARARILGVQVNRTYYVETPSDNARQLEDEIEKLQDEIKRMESRAELIKQNRLHLDKLAGQANLYATSLAAREMTVEEQLALFNGLRQQAEKLDNEILDIQISKRGTERRLQKLSSELEQFRSSRPRERYTANVEVEVLEPGDLTIEASYVVSGAGWKPLYDFRLSEKDGVPSLEVGYLAQITQNTGENWEKLTLTLSTARPALAHVLPELDPWYIRPFEQVMPFARASASPGPALPMEMQTRSMGRTKTVREELVEEEALEQVAEIDTAGTAITYAIPGVTTIPPDGNPHKVTVARFPLTPRMDFVSAPKLAQAVYRRAKVNNDSPYTLLAGSANIFVSDEYIGTTQLELTAAQGEIELYLGNEDRIKVERELIRRDMDKRFIGGKRHLVFGYEIKVENLLPAPASLTLHDQFPVPRHEEIKVKLESADPKPAEQSELNLLKWDFSLEPKEKQTVRFDFSVEFPQSMEILGLP